MEILRLLIELLKINGNIFSEPFSGPFVIEEHLTLVQYLSHLSMRCQCH